MKYKILHGDAYTVLDTLEPNSIDCVFTSPSPPFYSKTGIGSEQYTYEYIENLLDIFDKVKDVLKDTGSVFVHMGDHHDSTGNMTIIPEMFTTDMKLKRWILRSKLIWHRTEEGPQEDKTRFKRDWEYVFMFTKTMNYYFDPYFCDTSVYPFQYIEPEPGEFESGFPVGLIRMCILSGCPLDGTVLDPFCGTGTTGLVALRDNRKFIGIELDATKIIRIRKRLAEVKQQFP